jgi:hypothetical protein
MHIVAFVQLNLSAKRMNSRAPWRSCAVGSTRYHDGWVQIALACATSSCSRPSLGTRAGPYRRKRIALCPQRSNGHPLHMLMPYDGPYADQRLVAPRNATSSTTSGSHCLDSRTPTTSRRSPLHSWSMIPLASLTHRFLGAGWTHLRGHTIHVLGSISGPPDFPALQV